MAQPQFQHEHLRLSEGSIRLVQIHGSTNKTGPLSLRITQFATSKRPPYAAISYTWGSASKALPVNINGKPFTIRPNLYQLLLHLRQQGESRFLWVDALCINQLNDTERNFHVQFMSRIYEEAELAIVWLGLPSDDRREARAIDFLVEMAKHRPNKAGGASFRDLYLTEKSHSRWLNLLSFCKCIYWSRTWIIQEFVRARRIEVLCGTARLDWSAFNTVHQTVKSLFPPNTNPTKLPVALQTTLRSLLSTIPSRLTSRRLSHTASLLIELLHEFYDAQCTLPRDKVYSMLGIASDCGQLPSSSDTTPTPIFRGPVPDYAKHIVEVYLDVLIYLRDSSQTHSVTPLTVLLLRKSLSINEQAIAHYRSSLSADTLSTTITRTTLCLKADYVSTITATIPNYTSPSDLKQKLSQCDWSPYVGFEIVRQRTPTPATTPHLNAQRRLSRPSPVPFRSSSGSISMTRTLSSSSASTSTPTQSTLSPPASSMTHRRNSSSSTLSRQITQTAPLPADLISNAVAMASTESLQQQLRTYSTLSPPSSSNGTSDSLSPSLDSLSLSPSPQLLSNSTNGFHLPLSPSNASHPSSPLPSTIRPTLIIESSPLASPVRLGFTTPAVRRGDIILQFSGLDLTLIGRRIGSSGKLQLVGRAVMVTHSGLRGSSGNKFGREGEVHPACSAHGSGSSLGGMSGESSERELISPCLRPTENAVSANGKSNDSVERDVLEDQERMQWQEQWREHLKQHEDVEIETDALSLYEILRDM